MSRSKKTTKGDKVTSFLGSCLEFVGEVAVEAAKIHHADRMKTAAAVNKVNRLSSELEQAERELSSRVGSTSIFSTPEPSVIILGSGTVDTPTVLCHLATFSDKFGWYTVKRKLNYIDKLNCNDLMYSYDLGVRLDEIKDELKWQKQIEYDERKKAALKQAIALINAIR